MPKNGCTHQGMTLFIFLKWINRVLAQKSGSPYKIVGHFERHAATFILWKDQKGLLRSEKIQYLAQTKRFVKRLSSQDAFLLGYLFAQHHEKQLSNPILLEQPCPKWSC